MTDDWQGKKETEHEISRAGLFCHRMGGTGALALGTNAGSAHGF